MTSKELFRALGEVREDQIADAEAVKKQSCPRRRYGGLAACLALVLAGAFALGRLESVRKWAEIEENFQTTDAAESAADTGGGTETPDGADDWFSGESCPPAGYSVNVEIGELEGRGAEKRTEAADEEDRAFSPVVSADAAFLSPEEIFARDTAIFRGIVRNLRYYVVNAGGFEMQYTVAAVEVTDPIRGDLTAGESRTVLYMGGPNMTTSLSGPLGRVAAGSEAIFMPSAATPETGRRDGDSYFCYADLGEFYLSEGMRFVFLDTGDGLDFERGVYEDIGSAETLDEVTDYIRRMLGEPERAQPAADPAEPQADPGETDPALLDPSYGVEAPNGARELPGDAYVGEP